MRVYGEGARAGGATGVARVTAVARVTVRAGAELARRVLAGADWVFAAVDAAVGVPLRPAGQTTAGVGEDSSLRAPVRRLAGRRRVRLTPEWVIALLASALSIAAYAYYLSQGLTLAYGDAITHMMIAPRVVAGRPPGLAQPG